MKKMLVYLIKEIKKLCSSAVPSYTSTFPYNTFSAYLSITELVHHVMSFFFLFFVQHENEKYSVNKKHFFEISSVLLIGVAEINEVPVETYYCIS